MNQAKASLESLVSLDVPAAFPSFFAKRVNRDEKAEKISRDSGDRITTIQTF